jgi:hypothetical protein
VLRGDKEAEAEIVQEYWSIDVDLKQMWMGESGQS